MLNTEKVFHTPSNQQIKHRIDTQQINAVYVLHCTYNDLIMFGINKGS